MTNRLNPKTSEYWINTWFEKWKQFEAKRLLDRDTREKEDARIHKLDQNIQANAPNKVIDPKKDEHGNPIHPSNSRKYWKLKRKTR